MKKRFAFITILFFIKVLFFAYSFEYRVTDDAFGYSDYSGFHKIKLKKGTLVTISRDHIAISGEIIDDKPFMFIEDYNSYKKMPLSSLELTCLSDKLPEKIITYTKNGLEKKAIPSYYLDILYSENRNMLAKYEILDGIPNIEAIASYFDINTFFFATVTSVGIQLNNEDEIVFLNIQKKSETIFECEGVASSGNPNNVYEEFQWHSRLDDTPEDKTEIFILTIDGDYLTIYNKTKNKSIITLVFVNDTIIEESKKLFKTGKCNLSRITWPRHADGSCDYDGSKKTAGVTQATKSTSSTNVALNKTMTVKENLKLRSGEATSTQVLTVMSAGTKVKILELGKAETIDGISSNWVKVEVQSGAKDRDGKPIKAGTVGWCYGGYLE